MDIRNFDGTPSYSQAVQYYFELNKLLIELDPNLTNEEKSAAISNFNEVREFEEDIMESTLALQYYTTRNKDESWYNIWAERYIAAIDKKINYLNNLIFYLEQLQLLH